MAQLVVKDIDPLLIEKLKTLSWQHGRSLNEELIAILEQFINAEVVEAQVVLVEATEKLERARARYSGRSFSDSTELIREDRDR